MARQLFRNNFSSRFTASCSDVATTINITAGTGALLPALSNGDYILLTLYKLAGVIETNIEIVKVTAISTDTLTIERAQENTTAQSYSVDDLIECRLTASSLARLQDYVNLINVPLTFTPSSHNHDTTYLPLAGGSLSNALTFSTAHLKYGNSLLVSGLVIDSTKWYRVLSVDGNYEPWIELFIQIPLGHSVYRVRLAKGTGSNGLGWTAEVDCGGIYNYEYGNIIAVRVVDMGANGATYLDIKFNGNATRDIRLSIVNELANTNNAYATLIACTDQGTSETGVVSHLGFYDHATTIGVSKSVINSFGGKLSLQADSASIRHRYQIGTIDYTHGINSVGGSLQTRSNHPINIYTNVIKRMTFGNTTANTITIWGNDTLNDVTLAFATVGVPTAYTQSIKFSHNTIQQFYSDALIPNQINIGLVMGYDSGSAISNSLYVGNGVVAIGGPVIANNTQFQVNGNAYTTATQSVKYLVFSGIGGDSGNSLADYGIWQESGAWTPPYPDLCIAYHTGIRIGANLAYGGTRFYGNSFANGGGAEPYLMGVGDGAADVYFPTSMRFGSRVGQHINLYGTTFGIGIQAGTLYLRTGATNAAFSFHGGGSHNDGACNPGSGGVEYARMTNAGLYLDPQGVLSSGAWFRSNGQCGWYSETYGGGIYMTDTTWIRAYNSKSFTGYYLNSAFLAGTGNRAVYSDSAGTLVNTASDERLKKDITSLTYGLETCLSLNPVFYKWQDEEKMGSQKEIGLIAQQVQALCPEVIGVNSDGMLSLDYSKLIAVLINAVKALKEEIDGLSRTKCCG